LKGVASRDAFLLLLVGSAEQPSHLSFKRIQRVDLG